MQLKCMLIFLYKLSRLKRLEVIAFESFVSLKQTVKGEVGLGLLCPNKPNTSEKRED